MTIQTLVTVLILMLENRAALWGGGCSGAILSLP